MWYKHKDVIVWRKIFHYMNKTSINTKKKSKLKEMNNKLRNTFIFVLIVAQLEINYFYFVLA